MPQEITLVKGFPPAPDGGVPDFGPENPDFQPIALRRSTPDSIDEVARQRLEKSSINRALFFAYQIGDIQNIQMHFPLAEHFQHLPFEKAHWDLYENPEAERNRMRFMLNEHPERAFPLEFAPIIQEVARNESPLRAWKKRQPQVSETAMGIYTRIKDLMLAQKQPDITAVALGYSNGFPNAYQSAPILYDTTTDLRNTEAILWEQALGQITRDLQKGNFRNVAAFLNLHARIKDPITTLTSIQQAQVKIFNRLFRETQEQLKKYGITSIDSNEGRTLVTQLALESSFLALPAANTIFYRRGDATHGGEHQELPYVYINLKDIPRGEFTDPYNVVPRITEILNDLDKYKKLVTTPLAVSYYQTPGETQPTMFLIDGNNRATSIIIMDFLLSTNRTFANRLDGKAIDEYIKRHNLHPGWKREIILTLETTATRIDKDGKSYEGFTEKLFDDIVAHKKKLRSTIEGRAPALLVQESNFHTIIVDQAVANRPALPLLQPMHQSIYNHDHGLAMAIPPKNQTHGRAMGNDIRIQVEPIRRWIFSSRRHVLRQERAS